MAVEMLLITLHFSLSLTNFILCINLSSHTKLPVERTVTKLTTAKNMYFHFLFRNICSRALLKILIHQYMKRGKKYVCIFHHFIHICLEFRPTFLGSLGILELKYRSAALKQLLDSLLLRQGASHTNLSPPHSRSFIFSLPSSISLLYQPFSSHRRTAKPECHLFSARSASSTVSQRMSF